jgi:hypothetical protein
MALALTRTASAPRAPGNKNGHIRKKKSCIDEWGILLAPVPFGPVYLNCIVVRCHFSERCQYSMGCFRIMGLNRQTLDWQKSGWGVFYGLSRIGPYLNKTYFLYISSFFLTYKLLYKETVEILE